MLKRVLFLVVLGLLSAGMVHAQAKPQHTFVVGGCNATAQEALKVFEVAKAAPQFDLYIICDAGRWHTLAFKNGFDETAYSFTVLHKGMIWLGPKALENLPKAVNHELQHLRCDCKLGE